MKINELGISEIINQLEFLKSSKDLFDLFFGCSIGFYKSDGKVCLSKSQALGSSDLVYDMSFLKGLEEYQIGLYNVFHLLNKIDREKAKALFIKTNKNTDLYKIEFQKHTSRDKITEFLNWYHYFVISNKLYDEKILYMIKEYIDWINRSNRNMTQSFLSEVKEYLIIHKDKREIINLYIGKFSLEDQKEIIAHII